ncbi:mevalonate kinase [Aquibacillus rhizosphaerae]|uniref:mevalonate kinase n=1 Tax=Aquibacillus rhizosphaerae TaxID=3051431 RepID=A0ABT7L475_9BACI|nr:mevalonate kinase [Aquibacillus sp. LR5S19]MDL4840184.1 mevalonate kinase [Aquibacillus sp. LR5S19]
MINLSKNTVVGSSHGKLILVGEHSVVYGKPAIALPLPLVEVKASVQSVLNDTLIIDSMYYVGPLPDLPEKMHGIAACIKETLKYLEKPAEGLIIKLESTIPLGRGLGSSAAVAIAVVRSLYAYYGRKLSKGELLELAHLAETYAHGNPSGIDTAAASSDQPIWFQKGHQIESVQIGRPFYLVVADTGRVGDTHAAVASIKNKSTINPIDTQHSIDQLGEISEQARVALAHGNVKLLGNLLNAAQDKLTTLGVSDQGLNQLVNVARDAGAIGAKLTGGGRGGCIVALAHNMNEAKSIAIALEKANARKTWYFTLTE